MGWSWIFFVFLGSTTVIAWPLAKKFSDCNNDQILYLVSRACTLGKRSTQVGHSQSYHAVKAFTHQRQPIDADEELAMKMTFMAAILQDLTDETETTGEKTREIQNDRKERWPLSWTEFRRARQDLDHNHLIRACCSEEGCSPSTLAGLSSLCPD